jgi:hypothetical protein
MGDKILNDHEHAGDENDEDRELSAHSFSPLGQWSVSNCPYKDYNFTANSLMKKSRCKEAANPPKIRLIITNAFAQS